jgi:molybdate transport system substrate-binding protein
VVLERRSVLAALAAVITALVMQADAAEEKSITVFAAASLKNVLDEVNSLFTKQSVVPSYAASSALLKQIEQGAPADVFLSADIDWMDYGAQHNLIKNDTLIASC